MSEILTASTGLGIAAFLLYLAARPQAQRSHGFALPVAVLIFLLIGAGLVLLFGARADFPASLIVALLVSGSALFGIVFNAALARETERRQRAEKRMDIRRALRAEITDYLTELDLFKNKRTDAAVDKAFFINRDFVPFVIVSQRDRVFRAVLKEIEVLDDDQVESSVRFYGLAEKIKEMAAQMQSPTYQKLPWKRRAAVLKSMNKMEDTLVRYGTDALKALETVNTRVQGHSGREGRL